MKDFTLYNPVLNKHLSVSAYMSLSIFSVCLIYDHMNDFLPKGYFPSLKTTHDSSSSKSFWLRKHVFNCSTN